MEKLNFDRSAPAGLPPPDSGSSVADRLARFSGAVALIYRAYVDPRLMEDAHRAIRDLLDAEDLVLVHGHSEPQGATRPPETRRGSGHLLSLDIASDGETAVRLLLRRNPAKACFDDGDVYLLNLLRPHLQAGHSLTALINGDVVGSLASGYIARNMGDGLIITDASAAIRWLNPAGRKILSAGDGLREVEGRLCSRRAFETSRLEAALRAAAEGKPGAMLVCRAHDKHPYGLAVLPVKPDPGILIPADVFAAGSLVLVTIKDMLRHIQVITERLGALFGLTPAEVRLGALLLEGCTLQEAATVTEKAVPTLKTQLRSMLKKTGVHSQAELVRTFLALPGLI